MTKTHLVVDELLDLEKLGLNGKIINGKTEIYFYPYSRAQKEIVSTLEHKISDVVSYIYCESGCALNEEEGSAYICCTLVGNPIKKVRQNKEGKLYATVNFKYVKCYVRRTPTDFYIKLSTVIPSYPLDIEQTIWESNDDRIRVPSRFARYESLVKATVARSNCMNKDQVFFYEELDETNSTIISP